MRHDASRRPEDAAQTMILRAGAALDAAFGAAMLAAAEPAARMLRIALPAERGWFRLCAVLLLILAGLYALASAEPRWSHRAGLVAGVGRLAGAVVLLSSFGPAAAFRVIGAMDGALGACHLTACAVAARRRREVGGAGPPPAAET
jgi:hypothetical protein